MYVYSMYVYTFYVYIKRYITYFNILPKSIGIKAVFFLQAASQSDPLLPRSRISIFYIHLGTGKDRKDPGSLHIGTPIALFLAT